MNQIRNAIVLAGVVFCIAVLPAASAVLAEDEPDAARWESALLDDFAGSDLLSSIGTAWQPVTDNERGGRSVIELAGGEGVLRGSGSLQRGGLFGGPGTAGVLLPFDNLGTEFDINSWDGVRLRIRRSGAPMLLRIVSGEIANGDHFAVDVPDGDEFATYDFPFKRMGQVMSPQQPWRGDRVSGIELTCWSFPQDDFRFEIERIEFYRSQ
jgi:hypothetical protein